MASEFGMPALALTDHESLTGEVEFFDACRSVEVKPILGLEIGMAQPLDLIAKVPNSGRLLLLAMDREGWSNLCRISSYLKTGPGFAQQALMPFERLATYNPGLLCLSGGSRGHVARLVMAGKKNEAARVLENLASIFPGRMYVELQKHTPQDEALTIQLYSLAKRQMIPVVATHDVYYRSPEHAHLQRLVSAIRETKPVRELSDEAMAPTGSYFTSPAEMAARFAELPQALAASFEIAERCSLELPVGIPHYPELFTAEDQTVMDILRQKAQVGAKRLYGDLDASIQARLERELDVIGERGYASLFLIMEEIVRYAYQQGIPLSSRGSAASSLVAHCLGITSPDPIRLNLYFERFLNPARITPPDIDTDLCSRRRHEVIRFVYERFGQNQVAMVCTVNRFRRRSALREVAKAYGLPPGEIKSLAAEIPRRPHRTMRGADPQEPFADLVEGHRTPTYEQIFQDATALIGLPRHLSIHPGGVVISPGPLTDLVPTQLASKGVVITQFDLESIERLGLVKIDLLGIRGLTVLGDVAQALQAKHPTSSTSSLVVLENIPEDDQATAELVRDGKTIGCFQIESPGMRATLREIEAKSVDDIMVALALYRPGPLTGGLKEAFVRRHCGDEAPQQLHPALTTLLEDTYGVILYQEQVLRVAHELAGLSLADADLLRRAMSHFDPGEQMKTLKEKFVAGAHQRHNVSQEIGERIWDLMAAFAGYGFPKAHAASYAQVAWRSAWCKAHFPAIFMAAVLANWGGYYGQRVYLSEARRLGLEIRPPHINYARRQFSVGSVEDELVLFMGLDQVRDLTRRTQTRILAQRPFNSLNDFLVRTDPRPVEAENLIRAGALSGFGTIPDLLRQLQGGNWQERQYTLFTLRENTGQDWTLEEKVAAQETILGVGVDAHALELYAEQIAAIGGITTGEAANHLDELVRIAGIRQTWPRSQTARGELIYFMSLEDLDGMLEVLIPAHIYRRHRKEMRASSPIWVEGTVELDPVRGEPLIRAVKIALLEKE